MISQEILREWDQFERRNPGVAHPGRIADRIARGSEAKAVDYTRATTGFRHDDDLSFGQKARLQRQRNGGM